MKKGLKILTILTSALLLLTACREEYSVILLEQKTPENQTVNLRFMSQWAGADVKGQLLKKVLSDFMQENQNINVVNESMSGEEFLLKLKIDFASGNEPDVFGLWPGENMLTLIASDKVADLTQTLGQDSEWKNAFDKSTWRHVTENGRIYGIPFEIIYQSMFVNRDLFRQYHVKIPTNFTELKEAVTAFSAVGITPIAYNAEAEGGYLYQNMIASLGGRMESQIPFKGESVNECFLHASDYMQELYSLGAFPENLFHLNTREMNQLFLENKAAMIVQRSDFIGEIAQGSDADIDMIPFPYIEDGKADQTALLYGLGSGTFLVSRRAWEEAPKREASVKLLKHLTSPEVSNLFIRETHMLPAIKSNYPDEYYTGLMRRGRELIDASKEFIAPPDSFFDLSVWNDVIIAELPYVLENNRSAEELWKKAQERYRNGK